jgi:hypothetical protein
MDLISAWAVKIAEEVAPDEIDLAPVMTQGFINGGKEREELFRRPQAGVHGAFGPGEGVVLFPWLLQAIAEAGPLLSSILASATGVIATFLAAVKDYIEIRGKLKQEKQAGSLPDDPYAPLMKVLSTISNVLRSSGIPLSAGIMVGLSLMGYSLRFLD